MTNPTLRSLTHSVYFPLLTDQAQFLGCYKTMLDTIGIKNSIPFEQVGSFTHPIEEENQRLTADFMQTMRIFQSLVLDFPNIECTNVRITGSSATFSLSYTGG